VFGFKSSLDIYIFILEGVNISQKKYKNLEEIMNQAQNSTQGDKRTNSISSKSPSSIPFSPSEDFTIRMKALQIHVKDAEGVLKVCEEAKSRFSYYDPENPEK